MATSWDIIFHPTPSTTCCNVVLPTISGFTGVKTTCGNKYCCNPFHLIPQNVGVFVDHDSYLDSFELACELHTLKQQVAEYVIEQAVKEQEKQIAS